MRKLKAILPAGSEKSVLRGLQNLGCVELTAPGSFALSEDDARSFARLGSELAESTSALNDVRIALDALKEHAKVKDGMFIKRRPVSEREFRSEELESRAKAASDSIRRSLRRLADVRSERTRREAELMMMRTWEPLDQDLADNETATCRFYPVVFPAATNLDDVRAKAAEAGPCELFFINKDKQQQYCALIVYRKNEQAVFDAIRPFSFSVSPIAGSAGTPRENIERLEKELERSAEEEKEIIAAIDAEKGAADVLRAYYDRLTSDVDLERGTANLLTDETVTYFEGWVPADSEEAVARFLGENRCAWELTDPDPAEYDSVPVSLKDGKITNTLNLVTEMYSLPKYGHIDPNPLITPFFILFYGIMMADMAYGIVLFIAGLLVTKKFRPKGTSGQMFGLMIWGGISTFIFGALTGGFMGDFIPQLVNVATGKTIALPALFSPLDSITTILIGSMALGVVQIVFGMAVSVVLKCRKGAFLDAFFGEITWWVVFAGLALMFLKITPYVLYAGIALVVIGPLVQGKGFGKITGIFSSVYSNVTGYFGDILSYSRLMALMLSGCVIAQVFNTLASLFGSVIPFVIVALIGNLFNMALNILGCFVHDLRLQCLEFFGKFYEDGGRPFEPLENRTKYIDIQ
jgi:V/A-type H+-transporting ATPase subunit I